MDARAWVAAMSHSIAARRARFAAAAAAQAEKAAQVANEVAAQARTTERYHYVQMLQSAPSKASCTAMVKLRQKQNMRRMGIKIPKDPLVIERHLIVDECCGA